MRRTAPPVLRATACVPPLATALICTAVGAQANTIRPATLDDAAALAEIHVAPWRDGRPVRNDLARTGIVVKSPSSKGVAEEAPGAYTAVVDAADAADLA